ncbi:unnamed protein product [Protopolystoma xenopodis]|uniref:Uncharacterized protein n=1 Tax=Protopolystoma xenopodis TaxID=117903 RepID=A0A448X4W5_9PLAT|nr:unnamed protein product [Protopolystoma xenopodis]
MTDLFASPDCPAMLARAGPETSSVHGISIARTHSAKRPTCAITTQQKHQSHSVGRSQLCTRQPRRARHYSSSSSLSSSSLSSGSESSGSLTKSSDSPANSKAK